MSKLSNNNILIGVTGGIAAYKSPILVRELKKLGADIRVVMTPAAKHFITPLTLQAVSGQPVRDTLLDSQAESGMDHIELARWAQIILIAPASADFIARIAHGFANDLLTTLCLASRAQVLVAPAMNQQMWLNSITQANVSKLKEHGIEVLGPAEGDQACGEVGPGRMLEPLQLVDMLNIQLSKKFTELEPQATILKNKRILITAGPTWEAIDPVRGLTNHSSGKMGYAIAQELVKQGIQTTLISGPTALSTDSKVTFIKATSAQDMFNAVHQIISDYDIFISVAAVADYRPQQSAPLKIKKNQDSMQLTLVRNKDILSSVSGLTNAPFTVGFAAETNDLIKNAKQKLNNKNLNMIVANQVGEGKAFGMDDNHLTVITPTSATELGPATKAQLAHELIYLIASEYETQNPTQGS